MSKSKYIFPALFLGLMIVLTGCPKKENPVTPTKDKHYDSVSVINGTQIDTNSHNLCGFIHDEAGKGIPDVVVTDGYHCYTTDANGVYQFNRDKRTIFVYYSLPADCQAAVDGSNVPLFYSRIDKQYTVCRRDFTLRKLAAAETDWTLICVGDPQCKTDAHVARYSSETVPDINSTVSGVKNPYAITMGDIVYDSPNEWSNMRKTMSNQSVIFYQTIGNHDHLQTASTDAQCIENFEANYGPANYSFNRGDVHIISMDDVIYTASQTYTGGLTAVQYNWLKEDLSHVSKDKMVIFCAHIPVRSGGENNLATYHDELLELLSQYAEAHIMTGHTHYQQNYIHTINGKTIYEHIHGAACGAWWNSTNNPDGAPNGYAVYSIKGAGIVDWYYKPTRYDKDFQIRCYSGAKVWGASVLQTSYAYTYGLDADFVVANVWNSDSRNWKVELWQEGAKVCDMSLFTSSDWWTEYYHMEVLKKSTSFHKNLTHFYKGRLNDTSKPFEVRATDPFGYTYVQSSLQTTLYSGSY